MSETVVQQLPNTGVLDRLKGISAGGWTVIGAGVATLALEGLVPRVRWRRDQTEIVPGVNGPWPDDYEGARVAVYPGMGRKSAHLPERDGSSLAGDLAQVYNGPIDSCVYGNWGIGPQAMAAAQQRYYEKFYPHAGQELSPGQEVAGLSMGLIAMLAGTELLRKQDVPVPHINRITTFGSPGNVDHTFQRDLAIALSRLPTSGGIVVKTAVEAVGKLKDRNPAEQTTLDCLKEAIKEGFGGVSPILKLSMVRLLVNARQGFQPGIFKGVITPGTQFDCYISDSDTVVKGWPAILSIYHSLAEPYDATMYVHDVENAGHANVANLRDHMRQDDCGCRQEPFTGVLPDKVLQGLEAVAA